MSKPGRDFEEAVVAFARALNPSAKVFFDHRVSDCHSGRPRQVDGWVETTVGGHWPFTVLISCKDWARPLHEQDVDDAIGSQLTTRANLLVIYSRGGFTKPAVEKARVAGVACCTLYSGTAPELPACVPLRWLYVQPSCDLHVHWNRPKPAVIQTWGDLIKQPVSGEENLGQVLGKICRELTRASATKGPCGRTVSSLEQVESLLVESPTIGIDATVSVRTWRKVYQARENAFLVNGSYCFNDEQFSGHVSTPSIDTFGEEPGQGWDRLAEDAVVPTGIVVSVLLDDYYQRISRVANKLPIADTTQLPSRPRLDTPNE